LFQPGSCFNQWLREPFYLFGVNQFWFQLEVWCHDQAK
jgi:hypothetical protein